jgi:hypothetical protein
LRLKVYAFIKPEYRRVTPKKEYWILFETSIEYLDHKYLDSEYWLILNYIYGQRGYYCYTIYIIPLDEEKKRQTKQKKKAPKKRYYIKTKTGYTRQYIKKKNLKNYRIYWRKITKTRKDGVSQRYKVKMYYPK